MDNYPPRDSTWELYFPNYKKNSEIMAYKLNYLAKMGIIPKNCWTINKSQVTFNDSLVDLSTKLMVKIFLDDPDQFRVSWMRKEKRVN